MANPHTTNHLRRTLTIDTTYIILPPLTTTGDWIASTKEFVNLAKANGVNQLSLMSASPIEKSGPVYGQIHEYLDTIGVDYTVLRPSSFYANFIRTPGIKERDKFATTAGTGKVGFISENNITDTAGLPKLRGTILVGPPFLRRVCRDFLAVSQSQDHSPKGHY